MPLTRLPAWAYLIAGFVPMIVLLFVGEMMPKQVTMILLGVAMVWAMVLIFYHWKRLDEAARTAHRWAWYWGGSMGLGAAMVFAAASLVWPEMQSVFSSMAHALEGPKLTTEQSYLFLGVALTGFAQGIGFLGAWIYWWLAKR